MFMFKARQVCWCLLLTAAQSSAEGPGLGEALTPEAVASLDYVVLPDGSGLPAGSGNAVRGARLYERHCLSCHGENGADGVNDRLAGGHGTIDGERPIKTVGSYWPYATTVFDYIRRAMPYQAPTFFFSTTSSKKPRNWIPRRSRQLKCRIGTISSGSIRFDKPLPAR